jgi:hypothetical protein
MDVKEEGEQGREVNLGPAMRGGDAAALHRRRCEEGRVTRGFIGHAGGFSEQGKAVRD